MVGVADMGCFDLLGSLDSVLRTADRERESAAGVIYTMLNNVHI